MRTRLSPFILALSVPAAAFAWNFDFDLDESKIPPFELRPLHIETPLVRRGRPEAVIAVRRDADQEYLAGRLNDALEAACGVRLPVVDAGALPNSVLREQHVIALGNLCTNPLIGRLYIQGFVVLDSARPGRSWRDDEGYVIHTVHDPFGHGKNIVVAGGSDYKGSLAAVEALGELVAGGREVVLPRIVRVRVGRTLMPYHAQPYAGLDEEARKAEVADALRRAPYKQGAVTMKLAAIAQDYIATGHDSHILLYKELMEALIDYLSSGKKLFDGGHLDFAVGPMTQGWDAIEEHPLFSDRERLRYAKVHFLLARELRKLGYIKAQILSFPDSIRQNHPTAAGLSLLTAGLYFKRYGIAEADDWIRIGDICFGPQLNASKGNEDARGYNRIVPAHTREYCFRRGRMDYFDNGHDRRFAEECLILADNLGGAPGFGDGSSGAVVDSGLTKALNFWAWYYNDGRYKWLLEKLMGSHIGTLTFKPNRILGFNNNVVPVQPDDLCGIRVVAMDEAKYRWLRDNERAKRRSGNAPIGAPFAKAFDKIVFRESLSRDGQFLCLDGFSYAYHGHLDGNSFPEFSDNGRVFLIDNTYNYQPAPDCHNSLAITRNGRLAPIPICAGLEALADFDTWGLVQTEVPDYGGCRWQRSIFWRKGQYFLVVDRVTAREEGEYIVRCCWRTIGARKLDGQTVEIDQKGQVFRLSSADAAPVEFYDYDTRSGAVGLGRWGSYTYAEPVIRVIRQTASRSLETDGTITFANVFHARAAGETTDYSVRRLGEALFAVSDGKREILAGVALREPKLVGTDAAMWVVDGSTVACVGVTRFRLGDFGVEATAPVSLSFDLADASGVVEASEECELTLRAAGLDRAIVLCNGRLAKWRRSSTSVQIMLDGAPQTLRIERSDLGSTISTLRASAKRVLVAATVEAPSVSAPKDTQAPSDLRPVWSLECGSPVVSLAAADGLLCCGTDDGVLRALSPEGNERWRVPLGSRINVITVADLERDGHNEVLAGTSAGRLAVLDDRGRVRWEHQFEKTVYPPNVVTVMGAHLTGDEKLEVIGVSRNRLIDFFDAAGTKLRRFAKPFPCLGATLDIDGDGKSEFVVSRGDMKVRDYSLKVKSRYVGGFVYCVAPGDFNGDGKQELLVGTDKPNAVLLANNNQVLFDVPLGATAAAVAAIDLDGDGTAEAVIGSEVGIVRAVDHTGKELWQTRLAGGVRHAVPMDSADQGAHVAVSTRGNWLYLLGPDGSVRASALMPKAIDGLAAAGGGSLLVACGTQAILHRVPAR